MRIFLHDYGGYPFIAQLARALAESGHEVTFAYSASTTWVKGSTGAGQALPPSLTVLPISLRAPVGKEALVARWRGERAYGRLLLREVQRALPDVVISADTPVDPQARLARWCRGAGVPMVFWVQDLLGEAARAILADRLGMVGGWIGAYLTGLEARALRDSTRAIVIADDFVDPVQSLGGADIPIRVIENWTALEEIPLRPRRNEWSQAQGLQDAFVFMYSGTLGMKHDPGLLLALAEHFRGDESVAVVVNSAGAGADWLRREASAAGLTNLRVLGFQPYEALPDALATADVLVAVLEPEAAGFSVPSKVLTYLAAARPILLSVDPENLAAQRLTEAQAGVVTAPGDRDAFLAAADALRTDESRREAMGQSGRRFAESRFDIDAIRRAFEQELTAAVASGPREVRP